VKERRLNEFKGVILVAAGLIVLASLLSFNAFDLKFYTSHPNIPPKNFIRSFGAYLAGMLLFLFGWASYIIPAVIMFMGFRLFKQEKPDLRVPKLLGALVLLLATSSLIGMLAVNNGQIGFSHGGFLGFVTSKFASTYFGRLGGFIIFTTLLLLSAALVTDILISTFFSKAADKMHGTIAGFFHFKGKKRQINIKPAVFPQKQERLAAFKEKAENDIAIKDNVEPKAVFSAKLPKLQIKVKAPEPVEQPRQPMKELVIGDYHLPSIELLDSPPPVAARQIKEDLTENARILQETLADFGIVVKVTDVERGPVITRYELEPAPGVKVNKITALGDDIALAMKAQSIRIVAPIPGKSRVGVEVPNSQSALVFIRDIVTSVDFSGSQTKLVMALGKDIAGKPVVSDLGEMPHLLIAGTTGSGKTVCVNSLILSLLLRFSPADLKLMMVDPKMVELMPFNGLPHLLTPVITDAKKAAVALNWLVSEMEERYRLLSKASARNIVAYNEKSEKMPYIVVVIDELADLMMVSRDQIENAITRLAQLSRAVGIHLILATQRPSVDVITGVIKANFPARISFKVASKVDSRTVLDMNGADKLLGRGDMLFLRPGNEKLIRAQGALVTDKEIEKVVDFIKAQAEPVYNEEILREQQKSQIGGGEKDELFDEAVRVVMESNQASVSILQRRMRLGYTRAARMIDMMEQEGLVGPFEGSKPRRILVDREAWLESYIKGVQEQAPQGQ
jgi:S-DNA-T family DNA segregation ATPase FtsK/SpoIIIE